MDVYVYSIYDTCAQTFSPLNMAQNNEVAIRNMRYAINNDPQFMATAKDLELYCVGSFDYSTGILEPMDKTLVIRCSDLIEKKGVENGKK